MIKGQEITKQCCLSPDEYWKFLNQNTKKSKELEFKRIQFIVDNINFHMDYFKYSDQHPWLLTILANSKRDYKSITLPPFIYVIREVTDEKEYSLTQMSVKNWRMPERDRKEYHPKKKLDNEKHLKQD